MASIAFACKALCVSLLFIVVASRPTGRPKVFNVQRHGSKPDGKTDNANAFTSVWSRACRRESGRSKIYVPKGTFYLGGVEFVGPCKNPIEFIIDGTLLAPANPSDIKQDTWINFRYINNLSISGSGTLDGQGKQSWPLNDCHKNPSCPKLAMVTFLNLFQLLLHFKRYNYYLHLKLSSLLIYLNYFLKTMGFAFVNNSNIKDITSLNSKMGHFNFFSVHHFNITGVTIAAPGDSPNTDGIKMGSCSNIHISNTNIGTGDDCIAILSGTTNLDISNVKCGPGHGISVGSLGKNKDEKDVKDLTVRDIVFNGTSDGIRIKTWESSASKILVSNFVYENIQMIDVGKPINIDQKYCPHPPCEHEKKGESHVQIQDLKLKNIYGTSKNKVAVNLQCSKSFPCKNVELIDINIKHNGLEAGSSTAVCENVDGSVRGKMVPQHCLN
ncbi:exopolygalacturonase [Arabidopsis lyrata subsp. lyrata]|uniref:exopolygalacturonase n=1 Tax=Arabidopsis lyrata subsp. lyrata TaxID=81972 RepID=UPI000A29CE59|nr:exopolygalacturonase [Arabidopsis lyrata subsp. lyrata]|eukprot:XP_020884760.1 exopolygalacturonase [Arabidopsis lyrata subsp. lyrata]